MAGGAGDRRPRVPEGYDSHNLTHFVFPVPSSNSFVVRFTIKISATNSFMVGFACHFSLQAEHFFKRQSWNFPCRGGSVARAI